MNPPSEYHLVDLSENEINMIYATLADRPYREVAGLITKIVSQVKSQQDAARQPPEPQEPALPLEGG
jgi:hypothetical protein